MFTRTQNHLKNTWLTKNFYLLQLVSRNRGEAGRFLPELSKLSVNQKRKTQIKSDVMCKTKNSGFTQLLTNGIWS